MHRTQPPFFPCFHRILFGRPPVRHPLRSALAQVDSLCLRDLSSLLGPLLPSWLTAFRPIKGANSRCRLFTPVLTFWAFLSQVLDVDGCCVRALSRIQVLFEHGFTPGPRGDTCAYCKARARLPIKLLLKIARHLAQRLSFPAGKDPKQGRWLLIDGTGLCMPDTPANQAQYAYGSSQKPGCGFPIMKLVGLFDLRTGAWLATAKAGRRLHDATLAWRLLKHLRSGDVLIADRGFCSYAFICALQNKGVHVVLRLHQARSHDMRRGRSLGKGECLQHWQRPSMAPKGMSAAGLQRLPAHLPLRLIKVGLPSKAFRTQQLHLVTTLLDPELWNATQIAQMYLRRWQVELFLDDIKTTMKMDMLRTRSPHMIARELLMHMIAYNVVRHLMAQADALRSAQQTAPLSFKGSRDRLNLWQGSFWSAQSQRQCHQRFEQMLCTIAEEPLPERPGRREPRCLKRRPKNYQLLTKPRHQMQEEPHRGQRKNLSPLAA